MDVKALSFAFFTSLWSGNSRGCSIIFFFRGVVTSLEVWSDISPCTRKPMPPSLIGNDSISLSSEDIFEPNNAGMNSFDMILSSGVRISAMLFNVLRKYVYLCCSPCM